MFKNYLDINKKWHTLTKIKMKPENTIIKYISKYEENQYLWY